MKYAMIEFFNAHTHCSPVIYFGALWQSDMHQLEVAGKLREWAMRIASELRFMELASWKSMPKYVFDAMTYSTLGDVPHAPATEMQWAAFCMAASLIGWDRFAIESLPRYDRPDQHRVQCYAWEQDYQRFTQPGKNYTVDESMMGEVTRVCTGKGLALWRGKGGGQVNDLSLFYFDCLKRGHRCMFSPRAIEAADTTYEVIVDEGRKLYKQWKSNREGE